MIHVNLQTQLHEQLEIIKSFRSDGQMEFDTDKCQLIQRVKGQLTVTDSLPMKIELLKYGVSRILEGLGFAVIRRLISGQLD